jgi:hypothetical protein
MRPGGPRIASLDNVQYGLHYGVVCQNNDPDNLDRIKVRLPWLDGGDNLADAVEVVRVLEAAGDPEGLPYDMGAGRAA